MSWLLEAAAETKRRRQQRIIEGVRRISMEREREAERRAADLAVRSSKMVEVPEVVLDALLEVCRYDVPDAWAEELVAAYERSLDPS